MRRRREITWSLVEASPLRSFDPRTKLALSLAVSLAVMFPMYKLSVVALALVLLLAWSRLLRYAAEVLWRMKWVLVILFLGDWILVSLDLATAVVFRLILLACSFTLVFFTTTPGELRMALERCGVPHRYSFSLSTAFQSLGFLREELLQIREAQKARGAYHDAGRRIPIFTQVRELVAFSVPVVVLTTKRAWAITEAAYARGFESPNRQPYRRLSVQAGDWILLSILAAMCAAMILWP
jgi:energy-coupling factor transport system permease protein